MVKGLCMNCYEETEFHINNIDYSGHDVHECTVCKEPNYEMGDEEVDF